MKKKVIVISGPTASGKSHLGDLIYDKEKALIINADSMQVYKELPILSAQPDDFLKNKDKYALYSILDYTQHCSVGRWLDLVTNAIELAHFQGRIPVVLGGTGLYLRGLIVGLYDIPDIPGEVIDQARDQLKQMGHESFHKLLSEIDAGAAKKIHTNDTSRSVRAMAVKMHTGTSILEFQEVSSDYDFLHINLNPEREALYNIINKRFDAMLANGVLDEVKELSNKIGSGENYNIAKTLGYSQLVEYLAGSMGDQDAFFIAKQKTRNYAKRQYTWFRHQPLKQITFDYTKLSDTINDIIKVVMQFIE